MSKSALAIAGLLLAAVGFALGYSLAPTSSEPTAEDMQALKALLEPKKPATPRSAEQAARDIEHSGQIRGILLEPNPFVRVETLAGLVATLGLEDVSAVAEVLERGALGLGGSEIDLLVRFWASYLPVPAIDWAWNHSPDAARSLAVDAAMETAAKTDPRSAWKLLMKHQNAFQFDADVGREALVRGWVLSGQPGVEEVFLWLGHGEEQLRCLSALAEVVVVRDGPEGLARWLEELKDEGHMLKTSAYRQAAPELLRADLEFTLKWCDENCDGPHGEKLRQIVAMSWAEQDGRAALDWAASSPEGKEGVRAIQMAFKRWRMADSEAVLRYVDDMGPDGFEPWFEPNLEHVAMWKSWDHPLVAYQWASHIKDDARRELTMISITRRFREVDERGAEAWLEQSPLSEEARAKAREFPKGWKGRKGRPYPAPAKAS